MEKIKNVKSNIGEKFMDDPTYQLMEELTREYIETHLDMTIILYQIDRTLSNPDAVYNETSKNNCRFEDPIELKVMYRIAPSENVSLNQSNGTIQQKQIGNLTFPIFESQLEENQCDIEVGDIIAVPITSTQFEFFEVSDDGRANVDNLHSIMGYRKRSRSVTCVITDPNKLELYS